ncbi:hypothetical protein GQ44DRAFT_733236 [Phaeosphaeriaceae sp. PMI808]|nr:hypothetical protein GQ44DRAFT_733236 [Phaeosphaeriaceae sp. PMI808]
MLGYNQPYSAKGHHVEGLENPKIGGTPTATGDAYPTMNMEHRWRATIDPTPDRIEAAGQSGYHVYHGERDVPHTGKSQIHTALYDSSTKPNHTKLLVPVHGIMPPYPRLQQTSGTYTPLQRWEQETFQEQPWHGIARELMVDSSGNKTASDQENREDIASNLCMNERHRDAARAAAENN